MNEDSLVVHLTLAQFKQILSDFKKEISSLIPPPETKFLTAKEACSFLRITPPTLTAYVESGKVTNHRVGKRLLFKQHELEAAASSIQRYKRN